MRDVLGVSAEALAEPEFDLLAFIGVTEDQARAAENHVHARRGLAACPALPDEARSVFASAGEMTTDDRLAMIAALDAVSCAPCLTALSAPAGAPPAQIEALYLAAARLGVRALRIAAPLAGAESCGGEVKRLDLGGRSAGRGG